MQIYSLQKKLTWRSYTAAEALPATKRVKLIDKKKFAKAALDEESKTFVMHVAALEVLPRSAKMTMHPLQAAQIAALKQAKARTKVPSKYVDYADVFSFNLAMKLPKNTNINKHGIELQDGKQPFYGPIYSLRPVELKTLKTYIKTYLKTGFIQTSKSLAGAPILFNKKPNGSLWLYVDYWDLNNLTIKN